MPEFMPGDIMERTETEAVISGKPVKCIFTRIYEDELVELHGTTMHLVETCTLDYGPKLGVTTIPKYLPVGITKELWREGLCKRLADLYKCDVIDEQTSKRYSPH